MRVRVIVYFKPTGLPSAEQMELPWYEPTSEHVGSHDLIKGLPGIMVRVIKAVDGTDMPETNVTVIPERFHPWTINPDDEAFIIQPDELEGCPDQMARRAEIEKQFWVELNNWFLRDFDS